MSKWLASEKLELVPVQLLGWLSDKLVAEMDFIVMLGYRIQIVYMVAS